jgi:branched-chain amino acid transport system substrate-binding protein
MAKKIKFSRIVRFSQLALGLALSISISACKKHSTPTGSDSPSALQGNVIRVGEIGSLSGSEATFGVSTHRGIELAAQELNAAGGVKGKQLEVITLDDQSKPDEAATAVTKLITQNQVAAVLGEVASSRSIAMAPIAQNHKIPMITPSSTNPKVTELGNYIFRVCFIDPFQGEVMAKFAIQNLKVKKVAILRDIQSDYSSGLSEFFRSAFTKAGGEIVIEESYSSGNIDFKSQLTAMRSRKPEAIYVPGYYTEVGLIARQARELGIQVPLLGGDGWDSVKLTEIGGKALNNSYFSNHYSSESDDPRIQEFVKKFKAKYGSIPDGMSAMGYDATRVLADAMLRAKSLESKEIRDALASTSNFPGVTGNITINEKRNAVKPAVVLKIVDGSFKYQTTINP